MPSNHWQRWKNIMKAYPFEEKRLAKWEPPYIVQPKYDGVRCRAVPVGNPIHQSYMLLSSEENPIFSVPHINVALKILQPDKELDGELYCHGMSFEQIISITSRTKNLHPDHEKISFHVFDYVSEEAQAYRLTSLWQMCFDKPLELSPYWLCNSLEDIMEIYYKLVSMRYEGIIVRHFAASYERKRSTYLMKFKPKQEDFYKIVGYKEGQGKFEGMLGALVLDSGDKSGNTFDCGSGPGLTHSSRGDLWRARDEIVGKTLHVKYQHITSGKKVPRFPVFVEVI